MRIMETLIGSIALAMLVPTLAPTRLAAADKDAELILAELRQLEAQVAQLQRAQAELGRLLSQFTTQAGEEESALRKTIANTETTLADVKDSLSILSSRLDETNERLGNMGREMSYLRQSQPPLLVPGGEGEPGTGEEGASSASPEPGEESSSTASVAAAVPGPVELYNQAYTDYTQLRYPMAISGFQEVIQRYPESDLSDNSQYWIGECFMAQRQYGQALESFEIVLNRYPESNKLAEASYKKATALEALGRREEAIDQLELVIERFPRTAVERNAQQRLKMLRNYQPGSDPSR